MRRTWRATGRKKRKGRPVGLSSPFGQARPQAAFPAKSIPTIRHQRQTFYRWRAKSQAEEPDDENPRLKKLAAEAILDGDPSDNGERAE